MFRERKRRRWWIRRGERVLLGIEGVLSLLFYNLVSFLHGHQIEKRLKKRRGKRKLLILVDSDMAVAGGDAGYRGGHGRRRRQEARPGGSRRVAVLALVRHHQHRGVVGGALHVLPRRAPTDGAAFVVAPENEMTGEESDPCS